MHAADLTLFKRMVVCIIGSALYSLPVTRRRHSLNSTSLMVRTSSLPKEAWPFEAWLMVCRG